MKTKILLLFALTGALHTGVFAQDLNEGIKMVKYERYTTAEKVLQPLSAGNPLANYYLGLTQLGQGNKDAARATFSKFPDDGANMAGLARLAYMSGNTAEGNRLVTSLTEKAKKKDWQPYAWAGDAVNYGGGPAADAIKYYQEALKRGGDNIDVRIGLGDAYQKMQGGGGEGMNNYENAVAKDAKSSLGYSRIGKLWYDAHVYKDALANYDKAKAADPNNPLPYRDLAYAYFYSGNYNAAKENIEKYWDLSDKTCDDLGFYADILFLAKDYAAAISKLQEVLGSCGEKPYRYRLLGYSQYETKDYTNALQNMRTFFQKMTDTSKIIPSDYMYLARIYAALKQADSADIYYTRAITKDTSVNKKKTYTEIAESYRAMNTDAAYTKSAQYYKMALDAAGANATATDYFYYGLMNYYAKNYSDAARAFEEMESKFPDQPSATYWRGRVAAAVDNEGKTGAAVPHFTKWLAIPDNEQYKHKNSDLQIAYQYLAIVAYNKNDKAATKDYIGKLKAIDPADKLAAQLESLMAKPGAGAKTTGGTKPAGGAKPKAK